MITQDWRHATPEQKLFWRQASQAIAYNTITPLFFQGYLAGSEFLVYAATKLYIALELEFDSVGGQTVNIGIVNLYNQADALFYTSSNNDIAWDTTAAGIVYNCNPLKFKNMYFSRIAYGVYTTFKFNGYRLNII